MSDSPPSTHPVARLDDLVHQRVRLGLLSVLAEVDRADFTFLRDRLGLSDDEFDAFDTEAHRVVDEALEFAQNGTDPEPEDALKNVYA